MPQTRRSLLAAVCAGFFSGCLRAGTGSEQTATRTTTETGQPTSAETPDTETAGTETALPTTDQTETEPTPVPPVSFSREWTSFLEVTGSPFVSDGTLYTGSRNGVRAIDITDGTERWRTGQNLTNMRGTLASGSLYYTSLLENGLYRVDATSGTTEVTSDVGPAGGPPVVAGDVVVVGTDHNSGDGTSNNLFGLDTADFSELWSVSEPYISYRGGVAVDGQAIVGFGTGTQSRIESRDPTTGAVNWSVDGYVTAPLTITNGSLYTPVESAGGVELLKIDPANGTVRWRHRLEKTTDSGIIFTAAPTFVDGRAYLASYKQLHAVDLKTGASIWETETDKPLNASPAVVDDYVWVAPAAKDGTASNGQLYGFDIETGDLAVQKQYIPATVGTFAAQGQLLVALDNQVRAVTIEATE